MARGIFGLTSSRRARGGGFRGRRGRGRGWAVPTTTNPLPPEVTTAHRAKKRFENVKLNDEVDEKLGFKRLSEGTRQELAGKHASCEHYFSQSRDGPDACR